MPVTNDLTAEEQADFAAQGVTFETPVEPIAPAAPAAPAAPIAPGVEAVDDVSIQMERGADGKFTAKTPVDPAATVDPNAPPAQPQMVPHAALHAERLRANEAIRQSSLATARMNAMLAARHAEQPTALPDLDTDPEGYLRALEHKVTQFEAAQREETQNREVDGAIEQDEAQFIAYTPDYQQASEYYVQSRARELLNFYPPEEAQKIMTAEVRQIAQQSWQRGTPAAAGIYNLAQARGYRPGQPSPFAAPGEPAAPAAPAAPVLTPAAAVAAVKAGQGASRSLSATPGAPTAQTLNAEALLAMSDEEFEAYMKLGQKGSNARFAEVGGR